VTLSLAAAITCRNTPDPATVIDHEIVSAISHELDVKKFMKQTLSFEF
tara:strand:- start:1058 stop:1201 length:144 start_codon:yes stop_codon:yes gene_type:complete